MSSPLPPLAQASATQPAPGPIVEHKPTLIAGEAAPEGGEEKTEE